MNHQLISRAGLTSRFAYLGVVALLVTLPYAVPAILDVLRVRMGGTPGTFIYLLKPVENQLWYLILGMMSVLLPYLAWRTAAAPTALLPAGSGMLPWMVGGLAIAQIASAFASDNPSFVLKAMLMPAVFYFGYLLAAHSFTNRASIEKFLLLLLLTTVPLSAYAIAQSQGYEILPYSKTLTDTSLEELSGKQLIASTFGHPNYMAAYLAPIGFWALYFFVRRGGFVKWLAVIAGLFLVAALVVGGTRGPWLAVLVAAIPFYLLLTLLPGYRRPLLFSGGVALVLAIIILVVPNPLLRVQFDVSQRLLGSKEIAARFYYWLMAIEMWKQNPLLGIGYGKFDVYFWDYVEAYQSRPQSEYYRYVLKEAIRGTRPGFVHNDHLQFLAEGGLATVAFWLGLWSTITSQLYQAVRSRLAPRDLLLAATLFSTLLTFAVDGLFNFPLQVPVSGMLFWVTLGAWTAHYARTRKRLEPIPES